MLGVGVFFAGSHLVFIKSKIFVVYILLLIDIPSACIISCIAERLMVIGNKIPVIIDPCTGADNYLTIRSNRVARRRNANARAVGINPRTTGISHTDAELTAILMKDLLCLELALVGCTCAVFGKTGFIISLNRSYKPTGGNCGVIKSASLICIS